MNFLKWLYAWITFPLFIFPKGILTVIGWLILPPIIWYCVKKDKKKLPRVFWVWDNDGSGYRNCGLGNKDWVGSGDWQERQDYIAKGYSDLQIALHWTLIRNPVNNIQLTSLSSDLRNYDEIVVSKTSFDKYHKTKTSEGTIHSYSSPFPWRMRALSKVTDFGNWYVDKELIRCGMFYYPLIRVVYIHSEDIHTELIMGFKNYNYKVYFVKNKMYDNPDIKGDHLRNGASINIAWKRKDHEWA